MIASTVVDDTPVRVEDAGCDSSGLWTLRLPPGYSSSGLPASAERLSMQPRLPTGKALELESQRVEGDDNVGFRLWRASGALCRWMLSNGVARDATVLELGAGIGASGLFAAALGARHVVLTDGEADLVPVLEANARRNRPLFARDDTLVEAWQWRFGEAPPARALGAAPFDVVIGSDITYSVNYARDALCQTLAHLLESGAATRCIIAHEHRRADLFDVDAILRNAPAPQWHAKDVCLGIFLAAAEEHGLRVTHLAMEPGQRTQGPGGVVHMTTDLSILEISLVGRPVE